MASSQPAAPPPPAAPGQPARLVPVAPAITTPAPAPVAKAVPAPVPASAPVAAAPAPVAKAVPAPAPLPPVVRVLASSVARPTRPSMEECKELAETQAPGMLLTRGFSHYWKGRYTEALAHFEGALLKDPSNPHTWYGKALAERAIGDVRAANASLDKAVHLHADSQVPEATFTFLMERLPTAEKQWVAAARSR
jgi:tetratricopeptide (TPR) repeat protein